MQDNVKSSRTGARRRRNGKYTLNIALIVFVVMITFTVLSVTVFFNLDTVIITGSSIYSPEEIMEACGIKSGDNIIRMSMNRRENNIENKLVYIEKAELKWRHSSTVEIIIEPSIEAANLEHENINYLISKKGKILKISEEPAQNVMAVYGTEPKENLTVGDKFESEDVKKTENIYELIEKSKNSLIASKLNNFDITDRLNTSCVFENRVKIELGAISDLDYKFKFAYTILTQKIGKQTEGTLKLFSESASFIDKEGQKLNEEIYMNNMLKSVTQQEDGQAISAAETAKTVINFE